MDLVRRYDVAPQRVEIEITESVMVRNTVFAINHLNELRRYGMRVAIDDFGVGYSSLSYLKTLPISRIKIDKSFVADIEENDAIARAIIAVAQSLHIDVLAEGIESQPQAIRLLQIGCDTAQGFYYESAVPARQLSLRYRPESAIMR